MAKTMAKLRVVMYFHHNFSDGYNHKFSEKPRGKTRVLNTHFRRAFFGNWAEEWLLKTAAAVAASGIMQQTLPQRPPRILGKAD